MAKNPSEVNYIRHLNAVMERFAADEQVTPFHISLYLALFRHWNRNRFRNPITIARDEIMHLSKIRSNKTYLACIRELHEFGFIKYEPSFSAMQGTRVHLFILDTAGKQLPMYGLFTKDTPEYTGATQVSLLYNKHKENNINVVKGKPTQDEVFIFFENEKIDTVEAERFYNHFQANGWKVGGKTPMKDWKAAARNWILNIDKYARNPKITEAKSKHINSQTEKDYGEPL